MFANFNDVFKSKPLTEKKVPDVILNYLSDSLPQGTKYTSDNKGNLLLVSDSDMKAISIGGFHVNITDEMKKVIGENCTPDMVLQYAYNTQTELELFLDKDGFIKVNGEEVALEVIYYNFFKPVEYTSSSWFIKTDEFPNPVELPISSKKYTKILKVKRIPYASLTEERYESEDNQSLKISFSIDKNKKTNRFSISYNLNNATTIKDIVETASIFNAFVDGQGFLMESIVNIPDVDKSVKIDDDTVKFWTKVLKLEKVLNVSFDPPKNVIEFSTICKVEQLYQNLVLKNAIRDNQGIESITTNMTMAKGKKIEDCIGHPLFFQYDTKLKFEIFNKSFSLPAIIGIFNCCITNVEKTKDKKFKLMFESESEDKKTYISVLCFANDNDFKIYKEGKKESYANDLKNSKLPQEYLNC